MKTLHVVWLIVVAGILSFAGCRVLLPPAKMLTDPFPSDIAYSSAVFGSVHFTPNDGNLQGIQLALLNDFVQQSEPIYKGFSFLQTVVEPRIQQNEIIIPFVFEAIPGNYDLRSFQRGDTVFYIKDSIDENGSLIVHDKQYPFILQPESLTYLGSFRITLTGEKKYRINIVDNYSSDLNVLKKSHSQLYDRLSAKVINVTR